MHRFKLREVVMQTVYQNILADSIPVVGRDNPLVDPMFRRDNLFRACESVIVHGHGPLTSVSTIE